jgi:4-hydroxy-tetrahydrodipicolinate reductase
VSVQQTPIRVLLVGHGRMGLMVESLCEEYGTQLAGWIDEHSEAREDEWPPADVAIDFSTAEAVVRNAPRLAARGLDLVIGTTGWQAHEQELRRHPAVQRVGVVAAPNFAVGVNIFAAVVERAARLLAGQPSFGAWIHEAHHAAKRDAPSGTAVSLETAMRRAGYGRPIDVSSTRAGSIPGTHTVGFDSPSETITLTHAARDRAVFARGALEAARWIHGRRGWFGMKDVLGI